LTLHKEAKFNFLCFTFTVILFYTR
jgi:hypothetical protein